MDKGKLTQDVKVLALGYERSEGETVYSRDVPPTVWEAWVADGVVLLSEDKPVTKRIIAAGRRRTNKL